MVNEDTIDFLTGSQRAADTNPVFAVDDDPERAARALDLGATTGIDPAIVYGDLDGFERQARVALTQDIISGNPHLQSYVAGSPMAAKVSNDDYGNLDAVSESIDPLSRMSVIGSLGKIAKAVKEGFNYAGLNEEYKRLYNYVDNPIWRAFVGNQIFGAAIMTPVLGLAAGTAAFHGAAVTAEQQFLYDTLKFKSRAGAPTGDVEAMAARFGRDVLAGLQVGLAGQGETIPAAQAEAFNRSIRLYTAAGKEPPLGVSPVIDQMKAKEAEAGAAALEEAVASAQTSLTRERAPDMFADYIRQHTDESIGVPIDAVLELYGGKEPGPNDGLLGFTPRLREQMQLAMETGGDVQIPIADFLAKVDPAVAKALRDHVRLKPEGVTVEEGKVVVIRPVEWIAYHGTAAETDFGVDFRVGEASRLEEQPAFFARTPEFANVWTDVNKEARVRRDKASDEQLAFFKEMKDKYGWKAEHDPHSVLSKDELVKRHALIEATRIAGETAPGAAGPRIIPVKIKPGKTAEFDMEKLFGESEEFHAALREVFTNPKYEHTAEAYRDQPEKLLEQFERRLEDLRSDYKRYQEERRRILEETISGEKEVDIGPWKAPLDIIAAAVKMAKDQGLDTARITNLREGEEQIIVFNKANIQSLYSTPVDTVRNAAKLGPLLEESKNSTREVYNITDPIFAAVEGTSVDFSVLRDKDGRLEAFVSTDDGALTKVAPAHKDLPAEEALFKTFGIEAKGDLPASIVTKKELSGEGVTAEAPVDTVRNAAKLGPLLEVSEAPKIEETKPKLRGGYNDTRKSGKIFHGSGSEVELTEGFYGSSVSYYGTQGLYSTDALDVAHGYAHKRGAEAPTIYEVQPLREQKIFDMEQPIPTELVDYIKTTFSKRISDDYAAALEALDEGPENLRDLFDKIREIAAGERIPADEIQEGVFHPIADFLESLGYTGMGHRGGLRTKTPEHQVTIFFSPDKNIKLRKIEADELGGYKDTPSKVEPTKPETAVEAPTAEQPFVSPPGWMSKAQYDRYLRLIEKRQTEDLAIAERRAAEAVRRRESVEWKAKRLEVQKEVAQDFQQSREFAADEYFRDGLLYGEKIERLKLGEEFLSDEMKEILPKSFVVKDGINPDEVAGFFGYPDGQSMVYALGQLHQERLASGMNAPAFRRAALEAEIDRRMEERYGSFSEKVLEEAKEQALSETQLQLLHEDTLALAEKNGLQYPMTREQFDRTVVGRFSDALVKEVSSDKFLRDAGKAGRAVEDALLKGDFQEAFRQRQRQYVASAMAKEALKFEEASAQVDKLAERFAPREVSGVEQEYADFVQLLLRQAGFNGKKSLSEIADSIAFHGNESLPEFVQRVKGDGWEPEVAGWLGVTPKAKDAMTVGEFGEFKDALDSLAHIGREVLKIEIKGRKEDWAEWRQGVLDHIQQLPKRTRGSLDRGGRWFYRMDASLTRMEEIIKDLDLREELGPLYQAVIAPMVRSKAKEFDLLTETARYFKDVRGQFGKEWRKTLADTIPNDLIIDPHTNTPYDLSRENLIQIMLNWGTRSNIEKFTQGAASVKLGRKATKEEAAALEGAVKAMIDKHATKEDWDFVKAMWEPFRKYQPEADTVSRNVSGVAPKWIPGEAIETPFGTIEGAYWPVKYDRLGSNLAVIEDRSGADALFNTQYFRAATSKNYLKERTGYVDFLDINNSIESAASVLQQMIHDISFRDALVQANRVFGDKQIRSAIRGHYGVEYEAQLMPWLKRIAHKNSGDQVAVKWWNDWMRRARVNTIGHGLPLNLKVILSPDVGYPSLSAWSDYIANRTTYNATAMEKSGEIRHMIYNMDRDFREQMEAAARGGSYSAFQRDAVSWAFVPMMKFSQEFRVSTFMEKYNKARGEGLSDSEAAQIADSYVRERHGAASTVDLPAIMESTESMKILTMFYGYFNTMYNWQRQLPGNLRRREWDKFAVNSLGSVIVPAAFGAALFNQYKENDSWFKIIGKALLLQPLSTIPIVRDFANWWFEGFSPRAPAFGIFQSLASLYTDIQRATGGKRMKKPVQNTANVIGLSTGLPLAQIGRTGEFAHDVYTGEQRPRNIAEWWRGIVTGESKLKRGK